MCTDNDKKIKNLEKINKMSMYEEDWDGYGAEPFSEYAIELFKDIIESVHYQPDIAPTSRNSLVMAFNFDSNHSLNFEVCEDQTYVVVVDDGDYQEGLIRGSPGGVCDQINKMVDEFLAE